MHVYRMMNMLKKNKNTLLAASALCVIGAWEINAQDVPIDDQNMKVIKYAERAPVQGSSKYFTGSVTVDSPFASEAEDAYRGAIVNFDAGARAAWHSHPLGQTLIVISGRGFVQKEGEAAQEIVPGDVVWIPKNVKHWHGAAPDSSMSHVAIVEEVDGSATAWMEHVSDGEYEASTKKHIVSPSD